MTKPSLLLDDYLPHKDFAEALRTLAGPLGDAIDLPPRVDELGLVCPNVLLAARALERDWPGMRTFVLGTGSPRELNVTHAVFSIGLAAVRSSVHSGDCMMLTCVFGGGVCTSAKPKETPIDN